LTLAVRSDERAIISALARAPATQELVEAERARVISERQARVDRIALPDAEAETAWPVGEARKKAAATKVREAERQLKIANDELGAVNASASNRSAVYTSARQGEESALIAGADIAAIEAWKRELLDALDALRRPGVVATSQTSDKDPVTRKSTSRGFTNAPGVRARIAAITDAYRAANQLKLLPDQRQIPTVLTAARASWPKITDTPFGAKEQPK
jgi:hypothetical protein